MYNDVSHCQYNMNLMKFEQKNDRRETQENLKPFTCLVNLTNVKDGKSSVPVTRDNQENLLGN